jgi:hypothetical protein
MSKKFYAVNRNTGNKWKPNHRGNCLGMYDSGYLAEVDESDPYTVVITKLDTKVWRKVVKENMKRIVNEYS